MKILSDPMPKEEEEEKNLSWPMTLKFILDQKMPTKIPFKRKSRYFFYLSHQIHQKLQTLDCSKKIIQLQQRKYLNMIIKRKTELIRTKSKEKLKVSHLVDGKKPRKISNAKMVGSASVKAFKPVQDARHTKQEQMFGDQNKNCLNFLRNELDPLKGHTQLVRHNLEDEQKNGNAKNMRKSASTGRMKVCKSTRRSLSPALSKEKLDTVRVKYSSKQTSRSEKQKNKGKNSMENGKNKSTQKLKLTILAKYAQEEKKNKTKSNVNKSSKTTRHHSQHLKTEQSSKMPSVSKEMDSKKPKKKVKGKQKGKETIRPPLQKSKIKMSKIRQKLKNSIIFSDVSFQEETPLYSAIATKQNFYLKVGEHENQNNSGLAVKIQASIMIQKHFRGFLTRKYIDQLKYMVCCIIRIQKVWRGFLCRKNLRKQVNLKKKNLSIENSLVTIKDFSEQPKEEKLKGKHFFFDFGDLSSNKKKQPNQKSDIKDYSFKKKENNQKYLTLLESLLEDEELEQKIKEKIRISLGKQPVEEVKQLQKQDYVKNKINSEIVSEKSFNSPRDMRSPKNCITMNSPSSWAKNKSFEANIQLCTSPVNQKLVKRMVSPNNKRSPTSSFKNQNHQRTQSQKNDLEIKPFDTSFDFLEEFQMKIIDYLKEEPCQLQQFLERCQDCELFRTKIVLQDWDKFSEDPKFLDELTPQFALTENHLLPIIFTTQMKNQILRQPEMQIYLQQKNYCGQLWRNNEKHKIVYESMIKSIFDGLTEAIFDEYRQQSLFKINKSRSCTLKGYPLFTNILMNSLTRVQSWSEYHCGMEIPVDENDPNFLSYKQQRQQKEKLAINVQMTEFIADHYSSWLLWFEIMMGQIIFQELAEEVGKELALQNFV